MDDLPALLGGTPVRPEGPPSWPLPDPEVHAAVSAALADGTWGVYLGPHVPRLESLLAEHHGIPHVLTCASGTLALEAALRAVGVGPGDEVILPAYDFEPTFQVIHALGARPVLVDVLPRNACLDPGRLELAFNPSTKAVIASHLHGGLVSMNRVMEVAGRHGVRVIEDAAQAAGATVAGRPAGSWGDVGILSFGGSKLLSAGRGGAILTRHADVFQRARLALARGIQQLAPLSELQAAALIPQVGRLPERTEHRDRMAARLSDALRDVPGLRPFTNDLPDSRPAYYKLGFFLDADGFGLSRDAFVKAMRAEGVAFDAGFRALHVGRAPQRYRAVDALSGSEAAGRSVVVLHHPVLSLGESEVGQVATAVRKTYRNAARLR